MVDAGDSSPPRAQSGSETESNGRPRLQIGDAVVIAGSLPYLKTADPMPMLRPPDLVDAGEIGVVRELRQADCLAVRFRRGTFLMPAAALRLAGLSAER